MRGFLRERALPVVLLFVALVIANVAGMLLVFSRGFAFSAGLTGTLLQVPITLALALATHHVLTRVKHLPAERTGLWRPPGPARDLALATLAGVGIVGALTATLRGLGLLHIAPLGDGAAGSPQLAAAIATCLASSLVNAFLQQLGLQGLVLAAGRDGRLSRAPVALSIALFVASHASESQAPIYLVNVALFGLLTILLFFARPVPSFGLAVGLHGGWNATMLLLGLLPGAGGAAVSRARCEPGPWSGGEAGMESGLLYTLALLALCLAALAARLRRAPPSPSP